MVGVSVRVSATLVRTKMRIIVSGQGEGQVEGEVRG